MKATLGPHYFPLKSRDKGREKFYFYPDQPQEKVDFILLSYVLNVIIKESRQIIARLYKNPIKPDECIIVGVRNDVEAFKQSWKKHQEGYITPKTTFQTFYPSSKKTKNLSKIRLEKLFSANITWIDRATWIIR